MAANALVRHPATRPPTNAAFSSMAARRFKTEHTQDDDARWSDAEHPSPQRRSSESAMAPGWWHAGEPRVSTRQHRDETRYLPLPPPAVHGLRYGSAFPYDAVASSERSRWAQSTSSQRDRRSWPHDGMEDRGGRPSRRPVGDEIAQHEGEIFHRRGDESRPRLPSSSQSVFDSHRNVGRGIREVEQRGWRVDGRRQDYEDRHVTARHEAMPSLDAVLDQSRVPIAHHKQEPSWKSPLDRRYYHGPRDLETSRPATDDIHVVSTGELERGSITSRHHARPLPLPGIRQLSSWTERPYQLGTSRGYPSPQEISRMSHQALLDDTAPDISTNNRGGSERFLARLRAISHDSPRDSANSSPVPSAHHWSSVTTDAASAAGYTNSPAKDSCASSVGEIDGVESKGTDEGEEKADVAAPQRKKKKRKVRICTTPGCDKLVVDHGVCIRHGGGKRCNVEGCDCRAQNKGLCWKHGEKPCRGYTICQVDGCDKRAKSRGMCWSHGGGTQCKTDGCEKIAVSRGRCWAHGGGKRCKLADCQKPAALRMDDFCTEHFAAHRAAMSNGASRVDSRARYESW